MIKKIILKVIGFYQIITLPLGKNCRFWPSCSEYCCLAMEKHGVFRGISKSVARVLKCHPWHPGGIDLP